MQLLIKKFFSPSGVEVTPMAAVSENGFLKQVALKEHLVPDIAESIMEKGIWVSEDGLTEFYIIEIKDWR
jgi:hypothetical protein